MVESRVRAAVRERAGGRCEYCRLPESLGELAFHVEHIVARQHGGDDSPSNLAVACDRCNLYKGPNIDSIDPLTKARVPLFNPRVDAWSEHFEFRGAEIVGRTPIARATVRLLKMNASRRMAIRGEMPQRGLDLFG